MNASFLADLPLLPPPPGQQSDFEAPAEDATVLWVVAILTTFLALLVVLVRFCAKLIVSKQKLSWDDGKKHQLCQVFATIPGEDKQDCRTEAISFSSMPPHRVTLQFSHQTTNVL